MAGSRLTFWTIRVALLATLAGLLAWRLVTITGDNDSQSAAQPRFDRLAWEIDWKAHLLDSYITSKVDFAPCAVGELKDLDDGELVRLLETGAQLPFARAIVACDRYAAKNAATQGLGYDGVGAKYAGCVYRLAGESGEEELARIVAKPTRAIRLARDCRAGGRGAR